MPNLVTSYYPIPRQCWPEIQLSKAKASPQPMMVNSWVYSQFSGLEGGLLGCTMYVLTEPPQLCPYLSPTASLDKDSWFCTAPKGTQWLGTAATEGRTGPAAAGSACGAGSHLSGLWGRKVAVSVQLGEQPRHQGLQQLWWRASPQKFKVQVEGGWNSVTAGVT